MEGQGTVFRLCIGPTCVRRNRSVGGVSKSTSPVPSGELSPDEIFVSVKPVSLVNYVFSSRDDLKPFLTLPPHYTTERKFLGVSSNTFYPCVYLYCVMFRYPSRLGFLTPTTCPRHLPTPTLLLSTISGGVESIEVSEEKGLVTVNCQDWVRRREPNRRNKREGGSREGWRRVRFGDDSLGEKTVKSSEACSVTRQESTKGEV